MLSSSVYDSMLLKIFAALSLCWLSITSHNFFHRRDNWRMYSFNLTLMNCNTWRISHALSHHMYPNTLLDLEMSMFEPFLCWIPNIHVATKLQRFISILIQPIVYALVFPAQFLIRLTVSCFKENVMYWHDIIGLTMPICMWIVSNYSLYLIIQQWLILITLSSFIFGVIGLNAAHHDPKIFHEGDAIRTDRDWGLFQLDTVIDRADIKDSLFLILTHFGDHALHHLFPTIDHGLLPQLRPILFKTMNEFNIKLRHCNHLQHIIGQNKQLLRTEPNTKQPCSE